jgi:predicted ATP-grasp superfamily ATP-dependent carboligase
MHPILCRAATYHMKESYVQIVQLTLYTMIPQLSLISSNELRKPQPHNHFATTYLKNLSSSNSNTPCNLIQIPLSVGGDAPSPV